MKNLDPRHEIPKVNLVGHSRGGLTNMQYALDHPDIVDQVFSIDTPYLGTTSGEVHLLLDTLTGGKLAFSAGEEDIINTNVFSEYLNRWNNNYEALYKKIKVHVIGAYQSLDMLLYQLLKYAVGDNSNFIDNEEIIKAVLRAMNMVISTVVNFKDSLLPKDLKIRFKSIIRNAIFNSCPEFRENETALDPLFGIFDLVYDELRYNWNSFSYDWYNDCLVDLPSQLGYNESLGYEYKGFERFIKKFDLHFSNYNIELMSANGSPNVTHNMVPMDREILTYITNNINMSGYNEGSPYLVSINSSNKATIELYMGKEENVVIPQNIQYGGLDYQVIGIGENAFTNSSNTKMVTLPNSVEFIEDRAFYNNKSIERITFGSGSKLKEIGYASFAEMDSLKEFTIPNSVNEIGKFAFMGSRIVNIVGNSNYIFRDGLLIDDIEAIYANLNIETLKVPEGVIYLNDYLFRGSKIKTIDLNNVISLGEGVFAYSNLTNITVNDEFSSGSVDSFAGTPFLNNISNKEIVFLGKTLIHYYNEDLGIIELPDNIGRIGDNSIYAPNATGIVVPENVETIGENILCIAPNVQWLLLQSERPVSIFNNSLSSNIKIYVKSAYLDEYLSSSYYKLLENEISSKKIILTFYDKDGNLLGTREEEYYTFLDNYLLNDYKGLDFLYFKDEHNNIYKIEYLLESYVDLNLYPIYEKSKYIINLNVDNNSTTTEVEYGSEVSFGIPEKEGYLFVGWYSDNEQITDSTGKCIWTRDNDVENITAKFEVINYTITYDKNGYGDFVDDIPTIFNVENNISDKEIPEIKEFGFVFDGWYLLNGVKFNSAQGIYENIIIEAKWLGDVHKVTTGGSYQFNEKYVVVDMTSAPSSANYNFIIKGQTNFFSLIGDGLTYKLTISADIAADTPLVLGLKDIKIRQEMSDYADGKDTIILYDKTYIMYGGIVEISGGAGDYAANKYDYEPDDATNNQAGNNGARGLDGYDGGAAIKAYNELYFHSFSEDSKITITGGDGGMGGRGQNGQNGSDGVNPPSGNIFVPKKGDNGADGGDGAVGGRGGDGAYAIEMVYGSTFQVDDFDKVELKGGRGGMGGYGGFGGDGGDGASDTSSNPFGGVVILVMAVMEATVEMVVEEVMALVLLI